MDDRLDFTRDQTETILSALNGQLRTSANLANQYQSRGMPAMASQFVDIAERSRKLIAQIKTDVGIV